MNIQEFQDKLKEIPDISHEKWETSAGRTSATVFR